MRAGGKGGIEAKDFQKKGHKAAGVQSRSRYMRKKWFAWNGGGGGGWESPGYLDADQMTGLGSKKEGGGWGYGWCNKSNGKKEKGAYLA